MSILYENKPKMESKMWKIKPQKILGNLSDKLRKFFLEQNGHLEISSRPQAMENHGQVWFSEQIIQRKHSLGAPEIDTIHALG